MSKIETKQITLVSPNGLVEKTIDMGDDGIVKVNGVQVADTMSGVWTPNLTFGGLSVGITYNETYHYGVYSKVGKVVTFTGIAVLTSKGSSVGNASIIGLPFPISKISAFTVQLSNITYLGMAFAKGEATESKINLLQVTEGGTVSFLANTNFVNGSDFVISGSYLTD